jgi:Protein of unknown function (DUF3768)
VNDAAIRIERIRKINDQFRQDMPHGSVRISHEVGQRFSNDQLRAITQMIRHYDAFGFDLDAQELHDQGSFECGETRLFWQIEVWDSGCNCVVPDPTDGMAVRRIIRISLADEA